MWDHKSRGEQLSVRQPTQVKIAAAKFKLDDRGPACGDRCKHTLLALYPETRSPAARLLGEQSLSREHTADFIAHSIGKEAS